MSIDPARHLNTTPFGGAETQLDMYSSRAVRSSERGREEAF